MNYYFTSESVTEGHPDKVCDQISDAILDEALKQDENSRVACETFVTTGLCCVMGEITTKGYLDIQKITRETIKEIGYDDSSIGFDYRSCGIISAIDSQSPDIAMGTNDEVGGAGDQGIMFGYACEETTELLPLPIFLANRLAQKLDEIRHKGVVDYLRPDGKTQVTVEYNEFGKPVRIDTVLISVQTKDFEDYELFRTTTLKEDLQKYVINEIIPPHLMDTNTKILVNPTGKFVVGGPHGDTGLTGRKIIVDTYGGYSRHGGGAFSGKDPTKVDRSASYMARYIAKNVVKAKLASKCEVQLSYAIGVKEPVSIFVDTFGTNTLDNSMIVDIIKKVFDLTPKGIIESFNLRNPIYKKTATYGHFGNPSYPWEKTDKVEEIQRYITEVVNNE